MKTFNTSSTLSSGTAMTEFGESLARLDRAVDQVPFGWQRLYGDLRHSLRVVSAEPRASIRIDGAWEEDGLLHIGSESSDPVVQGVLRKARTRAMNTCMHCGKPGKRRELANWQEATWCAACAAPRLLALDIERVLALDKCGSAEIRDQLKFQPESVLIRAAAEAAEQAHALPAGFVINQLPASQVREWLRGLHDRIEEDVARNLE
jgi:hypothetical protein